ncbi:hypothetical protein J2Z60_001797 [Lactobacillus colini]|uniref:Uncharacterized protein n=1 Tax=Lactobacillus colini TaxID=1819254 RepID=A0ABS4MH13_9LACO|nr:hypothetical protein [Lactobacillus colini]MBP2058609.1 hypothetical protein [Lactobacillus colini]
MSKRSKKKKLTHDEVSEKIAKYAMIGTWSYPATELVKQVGKILQEIIKHK